MRITLSASVGERDLSVSLRLTRQWWVGRYFDGEQGTYASVGLGWVRIEYVYATWG